MSVKGYQDFWITGSRLYLMREDDPNMGLLDLGVIDTVPIAIEPQTVQLYDGDGGVQQLVDEEAFRVDESWEVTCKNLSPQVRAAYMLAAAPATHTQPSGGAISAVTHTAVVGGGRYVKLVDSDGNWLFNVAAIASVTGPSGSPSYTLDADYRIPTNGLVRGFIEIIENGDIMEGDAIEITMTMNELTGKRLIRPHSLKGVLKAKAMVVYGRGGNARQTARVAEISMVPSGSNFTVEEFSDLQFTARVISDVLEVEPSGIMLDIHGEIPGEAGVES